METQNYFFECAERMAEIYKIRIRPSKPPIGIEPEYIWKQKRLNDLIDVIARYRNAGLLPESIWYRELRSLITELWVD